MKLLFDENLSPKLPRLLTALFPDSTHVSNCGLEGHSDQKIWQYASDHGYSIVTKDDDFYARSLLNGAPPKVIWICIGNCTRMELVEVLTRRANDIKSIRSFGRSIAPAFLGSMWPAIAG